MRTNYLDKKRKHRRDRDAARTLRDLIDRAGHAEDMLRSRASQTPASDDPGEKSAGAEGE